MAYVKTIPPNEADGDVRELYEEHQRRRGYIPNYAKIFSLHPGIMMAWSRFQATIKERLDVRTFELATLAAARALRSSYCMLAHGSLLAQQVLPPAVVARLAGGENDAALTPAEVALMVYADKIARDAGSVTEADVDELRRHGLSDAEIVDIAAAAAARCYFSKVLDALGAEPDAVYLDLPGALRSALTVGRAIDESPVETVSDSPRL